MKIHVFQRHCVFSDISAHKKRPVGFLREKCFQNLLSTAEKDQVEWTFFLDTHKPGDHFLQKQNLFPVIQICEGTEAGSFLRLLDHVEKLDLHPETILYFLEDDYLHRPGWVSILLEGFDLKADYVTLYDHRDKYLLAMYQKLTSRLLISPSCHWRTTPSTTNTFAVKFRTFKRDLFFHRKYSLNRTITADHDKFLALKASLISPIPGWATHACEPENLSPCINWETYLKE